MNLDNFLCKFLDVFLRWSRKYPDKKIAEKLYYSVYTYIIKQLLPFMRNYDVNKDGKLIEALHNCRVVLSDNHEITNPIHIKRIDKIINSEQNFQSCDTMSKRQKRKYDKGTEEYRLQEDKKYRKAIFEGFIHDILIEYNALRKAIGLDKLTILQIIKLDQIEHDNMISNVKALIGIILVITGLYVLAIGYAIYHVFFV